MKLKLMFMKFYLVYEKKKINIRSLIVIALLLFFILPINYAQSNPSLLAQLHTKEITKQVNYITQSGQIVYVDFDEVPFKIEKIQLFTLSYDLLSYEFVNDLPKNTFYEINLKNRSSGAYIIQLVGKNRTIKKAILLK